MSKLFGWCVIVAGSLLVVLAAPRLLAAIVAIPGNEVLTNIEAGRPVATAPLDLLIASRRSMLLFANSAQAESDLGFALLLRAGLEADATKVSDMLTEARSVLQHSLSQAPARPYAWTRLAYAMMMLEGPSRNVAQVLMMAIKTAPDDGPPFDGLLVGRISLCLLTLPYFSADEQELVHDQLRLAWLKQRNDTIRVVLAAKAIDELVIALQRYPGELNELKRLNLL